MKPQAEKTCAVPCPVHIARCGAAALAPAHCAHRPWRNFLFRLLVVLSANCAMANSLQAQDLELIAVSEPVSGCALGNSEPVSMRVVNHGPTLAAGTSFQVLYWIDGGSAVNGLVTLDNALPTNSTLDYSFVTTADLSVPGEYIFNVSLNLAGDINPGNNTVTGYRVRNSALSVAGVVGAPASGSAGTLSVSGQTGDVVQWEESPDGERWFKLASSSVTQGYSGLGEPTRFRVRVKSGECPAAVSAAVTVTP